MEHREKMYTPGAPQFHLNPGTAALMMYYLDNPVPMEVDGLVPSEPGPGPEPMECSYDWDDPMPSRLYRQNALSQAEWDQLLSF